MKRSIVFDRVVTSPRSASTTSDFYTNLFDYPLGHTGSWGFGQPGLLSECYYGNGGTDPYPNIIDPTKDATYQFLTDFFTEILATFPDNYVHLGGDEVLTYVHDCW